MNSGEPKGTLVVIGGHEDEDGNQEILGRFVALASGSRGRIVVMTCASKEPEKAGRRYCEVFSELGAGRIDVIDARVGEAAAHCDMRDAVGRATGVFFVGGEPYRITEAIKGTPVCQLLHSRYQEGLILAGTSAGALVMPEIVTMDGESNTHPADGGIEPGGGLGLLKNVLLDVHFAERGRTGRMLTALAKYPHCVGVGIDEDTALVIRGATCEVLGQGAAFVFDASSPEYKNMTSASGGNVALAGVRVHVLPSGFRLNLRARRPEPAAC